jgi:hypothetical protein
MRNTSIELMQDNVFAALPHEEICDNMTVEVLGSIHTEDGLPVVGVGIDLQSGNSFLAGATHDDGRFGFATVPGCGSKLLRLNKNDAHNNGLSTLDLILVQKHILNRAPLDSPYKLLAADVDMSGTISTLDLIKIRKVILSIDTTLNDESSWRFIPVDFQFSDPTNPFLNALPTAVDLQANGTEYSRNFIAIKLGDVNNSADPGNNTQATDGQLDPRSNGLIVGLENRQLQAGQQYSVQLTTKDLASLTGYQLGLRFAPSSLEIIDIEADGLAYMSEHNFAILNQQGILTHSWHNPEGSAVAIKPGTRLFTLHLLAKKTTTLQEVLQLDTRYLQPEAYNEQLSSRKLQLDFHNSSAVATTLQVYQNEPNPFNGSTILPARSRIIGHVDDNRPHRQSSPGRTAQPSRRRAPMDTQPGTIGKFRPLLLPNRYHPDRYHPKNARPLKRILPYL